MFTVKTFWKRFLIWFCASFLDNPGWTLLFGFLCFLAGALLY